MYARVTMNANSQTHVIFVQSFKSITKMSDIISIHRGCYKSVLSPHSFLDTIVFFGIQLYFNFRKMSIEWARESETEQKMCHLFVVGNVCTVTILSDVLTEYKRETRCNALTQTLSLPLWLACFIQKEKKQFMAWNCVRWRIFHATNRFCTLNFGISWRLEPNTHTLCNCNPWRVANVNSNE